MNNQQWSNSESAVEMLSALTDEEKHKFKIELQLYFIDCCKYYLHLLPHKEFRVALELAEQFSSGLITAEKVRDYNWYTESAVFSMDYDTDTNRNMEIYTNIEEKLSLPNILDARAFAVSLGYFIDWTSLYLSDFDGKTNNEHEQFWDANMLRKRIHEPF
jgi:hypothetical protein